MVSRLRALVIVPFVVVLAACGGGSSSDSSSAAPASSSAAPASTSAAPASSSAAPTGDASFSPECTQAIVGLSSWYSELAGLAMGLVTETEVTPQLTAQFTSTADTWDGYASSLETAFPDAPASYAAAAAAIKAQATTLRTWLDNHTTTKGLAEAMDAATTGAPGEQIQAAITDLESRCAPWTFG